MLSMQGSDLEGWHESCRFQHQQPYKAFEDASRREHDETALPKLHETVREHISLFE